MRVTPLVGKKLWFGPRGQLGWGWTPVSWEGWAVVGAFVVIAVAGSTFAGLWTMVIALVLLLVTCALKGTVPGGGSAGAEFRRQRRSKQ